MICILLNSIYRACYFSEFVNGIELSDTSGRPILDSSGQSVTSKKSATKAIFLVTFSRILMAIPGMCALNDCGSFFFFFGGGGRVYIRTASLLIPNCNSVVHHLIYLIVMCILVIPPIVASRLECKGVFKVSVWKELVFGFIRYRSSMSFDVLFIWIFLFACFWRYVGDSVFHGCLYLYKQHSVVYGLLKYHFTMPLHIVLQICAAENSLFLPSGSYFQVFRTSLNGIYKLFLPIVFIFDAAL